MSTPNPPAHDVREALANLPSDLNSELRLGAHWSRLICDEFEVRPRGTVTDAEVVEIANRAQDNTGISIWPRTVRAVLEAAREARS